MPARDPARDSASDAEVVYARRAVSRRAWAVPFVLLAAVTLVLVVRDLPDVRPVTAVAAVGGFSPALVIWLLTLWSIDRYGAITLTRSTLRVGRHRVPVREVDAAWVRMLATRASPGLRDRVLASAGTFDVPGVEASSRDRGRLLGGGFGAAIGADRITLRLVDGTRVSAQTGDREGLLSGLLTALDG